MNRFVRLVAAPLMFAMGLFSLSACGYDAATKTASFSTAALSANATAAVTAIQDVEAVPAVAEVLKDNSAAADKVAAALKSIQTIASETSNATGGTVSVVVGKNWAQNLSSEIQEATSALTPLVSALDPKIGSYLNLATDLIPLVNGLVQTFGVESNQTTLTGATLNGGISAYRTPAQVRAQIMAGPGL